MAYDFLETTRDDNVTTVILNRPDKRNALSIAVRNEIDDAFQELEQDDAVSVVIIRSNGPVFCAGFDLKEFEDRSPEHLEAVNDSSERYHKRLAEFPKPIVVGIQGPAMAGGFDLAVLCDVRIATPQAVFAHPEIKFGAPALFGPLREIIGGGLARDLVLSGRKIDAQEALRIGLVSQIVEPEDLEEGTLQMARQIAEAPLATLKAIKSQIVNSYGGWQPQGGGGDIFSFL